MRYYLVKISYNEEAGAEDRPSPSAHDSFDDANKAFHSFMYQSINNSALGWAMGVILNEYGNTEKYEKWTRPSSNEEA